MSLNAHIRRANPRSTKGFESSAVERHRIVRRSVRWEDCGAGSGSGKVEGLVFRCYQSDIASGFEFIQRSWMNDGDAFSRGRQGDPIIGASPAYDNDPFAFERNQFTLETKHPTGAIGPLTTPLGTLYALIPGRRALRGLVEGRWTEPRLP